VKYGLSCLYSLIVLVFLGACAPVTIDQYIADGGEPLTGKQLHELLADHNFHLEAIDFDAKVQYQSNGHLTATSLQGDEDKGKWSITPENLLCMKFDVWYFGDLKCYKLIEEKDQYLFFTTNGARYYTGTRSSGYGETLTDPQQTKDIVKRQSTPKAVPLSNEDKIQTLIGLARNCPDCSFTGVDLRGAQLIGANLVGANLSGADLRDTNLRRANLIGANLAGADLSRSNLAGANLTDCDLSDADLSGSNLIRANVTGAIFKGAILTGAHLESIQGYKK